MPRFVLLYHDWPGGPRGSHCDLMFEVGTLLRTWSLSQLPAAWRGVEHASISDRDSVPAEPLRDHRLEYLQFEGPVSGDRGSVRRLDHGECSVCCDTDERFEAEIRGENLNGTVLLERVAGGWQLTWR